MAVKLKDKAYEARRRIRRKIHDHQLVKGIMHGDKAFTGPTTAQFDITNRCNNDCIACWVRSPLLEEKAATEEWREMELSKEKVISLIDDLADMGTQKIFFAGGGEPFIHPDIMEILGYVKEKGLTIEMNSNFTLVDKDRGEMLVKMGVDHINVSLWAGTSATYKATHPNKRGEDAFEKITEVLAHIAEMKQKYERQKPVISLYNVIMNKNHHEIREMLEYAYRIKADVIDFTMVDTIPGKTEQLLLSDVERADLLESLEMVNSWGNEFGIIYDHIVQTPTLDHFIRRVSNDNTTKGEYDSNIVESIPCYAGWNFTRISANGNVDPCLKAHRIPIGNLNEMSFKELWDNEKQKEFRKKTRTLEKRDDYFFDIGQEGCGCHGCLMSCDNLGMNLESQHAINTTSGIRKKMIDGHTKKHLKKDDVSRKDKKSDKKKKNRKKLVDEMKIC